MTMMKKFLLSMMLLCSFAAEAATTYVCNCDTGADYQCVSGSDSNAGTSSSAPKKTITAIQAALSSSFTAGDQLLLCEGGSWNAVAGLTVDTSGKTPTAANPYVFGSYAPSWSGAPNPLITFSGTGTAGLSFTGSGSASGFALKKMILKGPNNNFPGVALTSGWKFVSLDKMDISLFMTGINATGAANIAVRDSTIQNNLGVGLSVTSNNLLAERNTFSNNGNCSTYSGGSPCPVAALRNSIRIEGGSTGSPTSNITLRGNNITKSSYYSSTCGGPAIFGRGNVNGLTIESNFIYETARTVACSGVAFADTVGNVNEGVTNLVVRSNNIVNMGDNYITCAACVNPLIENNSLVNVTALASQTKMVGIIARTGGSSLNTTGAKIQNNTIYMANSPSTTSSAIFFSATGTGTGNTVVNNIVRINSGGTKCWDTGAKSPSDFATFNYNLCYNAGTGGNTPPTGLNVNGSTADPLLLSAPYYGNKYKMFLSSASPAVASGTTGARIDANGRVRLANDLGAISGVDAVSNWITVASENYPSPTITGYSGLGRYGHPAYPDKYIYHQVTSGQACTGSTFAASYDPAPGLYKECQVLLNGTNVGQAIDPTTLLPAKPVVNVPLLPGPLPGNSIEKVGTGSADMGPFDIGAFRTNCAFSHVAFDDPLIFPGQPGASHLHTFFGNTGANAFSTPSSILNSGNSTCNGGTVNRTGYWVPAMMDLENGTPIIPDGTSWYYKSAYYGVVPELVEAFPAGLRIIAGKPTDNLTTPDNEFVRIACSADGTVGTNFIPDCPVGQTIDIGIQFPQCWDGINLDSIDHISHMSYANVSGTKLANGCPTAFPHALPEISLNLHYVVLKPRPDLYMKLSSDNYVGQGGRSMHADWFNGWKQAIMDRWIANCIHLRASSSNALCDGGGLDF